MASDEKPSKPSPSEGWKGRILIPTLIAGVVGGGFGLVSKHRKTYGLANISATYATNCSIVTGCYCGAREFVRASRASGPDDLINSAIGGFGCGALLGRLQGGQLGAIRYSVVFAVVGTTVDFATMRLKPLLQKYGESIFGGSDGSEQNTPTWLRLPEWSPIQVLDEEALAAKRAREQQLYAQRTLGNLNEKES
ncbi:uncharacterized protein LOC122088216 [Macadamia integrifolia]|uniref:uncharacterized protein LOC122088216 n=1 Tax=Macadamia integrifolia TaxID=60698 RepID=UPI001C4E7DF7|nr:uncharacterized protein LOC122088216 [Macadamia integrifolia]